jgi:aryl-alcohol dehydrogenase
VEIKGAVAYGQSGKFSIEQLQLSDPNDDEVLVRISGVGICHTDLAGRDLHLPIPPERALPGVFGHEGAGVVEKLIFLYA